VFYSRLTKWDAEFDHLGFFMAYRRKFHA
jgi:hypothetical protein